MPSYVIHHIAGSNLLKKIENGYRLDNDKKGLFLLGNLIPDSSKVFGNETDPEKRKKLKDEHMNEFQQEKVSTHFRRREDEYKNVQLPYLEDFMEKYGNIISNPAVLGYYYHLYTDLHFFKDVFDETFKCLTENGTVSDNWADTKKYQILKNGNLVNCNAFWSHEYIYGDYTKINKLLLDYYNVTFNEEELRQYLKLFTNPGIDEVDFKNILSVFNETNGYIKESMECKDMTLNVFNKDNIINFIDYISNKFIDENEAVVKQMVKKKTL